MMSKVFKCFLSLTSNLKIKYRELTTHEFDPTPRPQNDQENCSQIAQHSQMGNEDMHMAWTHFQTNNQKPAIITKKSSSKVREELFSMRHRIFKQLKEKI